MGRLLVALFVIGTASPAFAELPPKKLKPVSPLTVILKHDHAPLELMDASLKAFDNWVDYLEGKLQFRAAKGAEILGSQRLLSPEEEAQQFYEFQRVVAEDIDYYVTWLSEIPDAFRSKKVAHDPAVERIESIVALAVDIPSRLRSLPPPVTPQDEEAIVGACRDMHFRITQTLAGLGLTLMGAVELFPPEASQVASIRSFYQKLVQTFGTHARRMCFVRTTAFGPRTVSSLSGTTIATHAGPGPSPLPPAEALALEQEVLVSLLQPLANPPDPAKAVLNWGTMFPPLEEPKTQPTGPFEWPWSCAETLVESN